MEEGHPLSICERRADGSGQVELSATGRELRVTEICDPNSGSVSRVELVGAGKGRRERQSAVYFWEPGR